MPPDPKHIRGQRFPLHQAVLENNITKVKEMLSNEKNRHELMRRYDNSGQAALHLAASNGNADLVNILLQNGAKVDEIDVAKQIPLHYSILAGSEQTVLLLIQSGSSVNHRRLRDGWTPIFLASIFGKEQIVRLLVDSGADVLLADNLGLTPEDWAAKYHIKAVQKILRAAPRRITEESGKKYVEDPNEVVEIPVEVDESLSKLLLKIEIKRKERMRKLIEAMATEAEAAQQETDAKELESTANSVLDRQKRLAVQSSENPASKIKTVDPVEPLKQEPSESSQEPYRPPSPVPEPNKRHDGALTESKLESNDKRNPTNLPDSKNVPKLVHNDICEVGKSSKENELLQKDEVRKQATPAVDSKTNAIVEPKEHVTHSPLKTKSTSPSETVTSIPQGIKVEVPEAKTKENEPNITLAENFSEDRIRETKESVRLIEKDELSNYNPPGIGAEVEEVEGKKSIVNPTSDRLNELPEPTKQERQKCTTNMKTHELPRTGSSLDKYESSSSPHSVSSANERKLEEKSPIGDAESSLGSPTRPSQSVETEMDSQPSGQTELNHNSTITMNHNHITNGEINNNNLEAKSKENHNKSIVKPEVVSSTINAPPAGAKNKEVSRKIEAASQADGATSSPLVKFEIAEPIVDPTPLPENIEDQDFENKIKVFNNYKQFGAMYLNKGNSKRAEWAFSNGIKQARDIAAKSREQRQLLQATETEFRLLRAKCLREMDRLEEARVECLSVLALDPGEANAALLLSALSR